MEVGSDRGWVGWRLVWMKVGSIEVDFESLVIKIVTSLPCRYKEIPRSALTRLCLVSFSCSDGKKFID
jgi:hypothetical protein